MFENKKVLIVDDEEKARLYLASILSELHPDIEIQLASSPAECLFLHTKQVFDAIFLDVEMPGMTGLELVGEIRNNNKFIPVIFVSAYKRAEFIQQALRLDAVDYLDKPVNPTELDFAINKAFDKKLEPIQNNRKIMSNRFCLLTDIDERFVESDEILCFKSNKRYAIAYFTDGTNRLIRTNLINLLKILPNDCFVQISRQYIVNMKYVKNISRSLKEITLKDGKNELKINKVFPYVFGTLN